MCLRVHVMGGVCEPVALARIEGEHWKHINRIRVQIKYQSGTLYEGGTCPVPCLEGTMQEVNKNGQVHKQRSSKQRGRKKTIRPHPCDNALGCLGWPKAQFLHLHLQLHFDISILTNHSTISQHPITAVN